MGRSPLAAFGIGMVHGIGGSAGVGILIVGAASSQVTGVAALVLFAAATAVSMALVSSSVWLCFGARARGPGVPAHSYRYWRLASLAFGVWYAFGAVGGRPFF